MTKILCLYTGGTIGCQLGEHGLAPAPGLLNNAITTLAAQLPHHPDITVIEYPQLLDSSNMGPQEWNQIAQDIATHYDHFDGFVVLHGTDTLAYTAAALSFQLENLGKPVLITGAQYPWHTTGSDASSNVALAIRNACGAWAGVRVAFGGQLFPATRIKKHSTESKHAFTAPNWDGSWAAPLQPTEKIHAILLKPTNDIIGIKLYPGANYDWLTRALHTPVQGIVLESYGSGNLPDHAGLIAALKQQAQSGAIIINCSQCYAGQVHSGQYAASRHLLEIGAISAHDMSAEAALCKLYYLFATRSSLEAIKRDCTRNLRGEIHENLC